MAKGEAVVMRAEEIEEGEEEGKDIGAETEKAATVTDEGEEEVEAGREAAGDGAEAERRGVGEDTR